jgi:hypothetical protein
MRFNAVFADKTEQNMKQVTQKLGGLPFLGDEEAF